MDNLISELANKANELLKRMYIDTEGHLRVTGDYDQFLEEFTTLTVQLDDRVDCNRCKNKYWYCEDCRVGHLLYYRPVEYKTENRKENTYDRR